MTRLAAELAAAGLPVSVTYVESPGGKEETMGWNMRIGAILEEATGMSLGEMFRAWIAEPIGMQDFRVEDVAYTEGSESIYPAWRFWITART